MSQRDQNESFKLGLINKMDDFVVQVVELKRVKPDVRQGRYKFVNETFNRTKLKTHNTLGFSLSTVVRGLIG